MAGQRGTNTGAQEAQHCRPPDPRLMVEVVVIAVKLYAHRWIGSTIGSCSNSNSPHVLLSTGSDLGFPAGNKTVQVAMHCNARLCVDSQWYRCFARAPCNQICARAWQLERTGTFQVQTGPLEHQWMSGQKQQKARRDARHKSLSKKCTRQHALNSHCAELSQLERALLMIACFYSIR